MTTAIEKTRKFYRDQRRQRAMNGEMLDHQIKTRAERRPTPAELTCPTCNTPGALTVWEKRKGYQCPACTRADEGPC